MKYLTMFCFVIFCQVMSGCTISHEFGPYQGKVVDKETQEPIEGAVVFIKFCTETGSLGGSVTGYADAVETLTNEDGEFFIPPHKVKRFRFFSWWQEAGYVTIFKPGYGAFPRHPKSESKPNPFYPNSPQEAVTIQLPKLHSVEERKRYIPPDPGLDVPERKKINLLRLKCIERLNVGLKPTKYCDEGNQ